MVQEEQVDLIDDQLKMAGFAEDETTTQAGTMSDTRSMMDGDGKSMAIEDIPEKEVLFKIYNGFFQFALDDPNIPKSEYGIVRLETE